MSVQVTPKLGSNTTQGDCSGGALCGLPIITDGIAVRAWKCPGPPRTQALGMTEDSGSIQKAASVINHSVDKVACSVLCHYHIQLHPHPVTGVDHRQLKQTNKQIKHLVPVDKKKKKKSFLYSINKHSYDLISLG